MTAGGLVRTLVVDDEEAARQILRELLSADPETELVGECAGGDEAVEAIRRRRPDLVFLDVQMPGRGGFGVLEALAGEVLPLVVFVTAYDRYALRAFDVHALDYLLKPFDDERFSESLARAKQALRQNRAADVSRRLVDLLESRSTAAVDTRGPLRRIMVRTGSRVYFIKTEEIDWIEAADYYARIHTGSRCHLLRESLATLERRLDPGQFLRIHRSAIVNLDRVKEMLPQTRGAYVVVLDDGTSLRLSRHRRAGLEAFLGGKP